MRKIVAALAALLLLACVWGAGAQEADVAAMMRTMAEEAIGLLRQDATGWTADILAQAQVTDVAVKEDGSSATATVTLPRLKCGVTSKRKMDDAQAYLADALTWGETVERSLTAKVVYGEDGSVTFKWSGDENPTKLLSSVKKLAAADKSTYNLSGLRTALNARLLSAAVELPKRQPETVPDVPVLSDYGAEVAQALGVSASSAANRLTPLMLLMEITKVDVSASLESTVLTVRVKDWHGMLADAEAQAMERMRDMLGVPEISREELDQVLCDQLRETFLTYVYTKSGIATEKLTVSLPAVAHGGPADAEGLMDYFRAYMAEVDAALDRLMAYAATLPYYPEIPLIDTAVLTGASDETGSRVAFDLGGDTVNHAYVLVERGGGQVLSGFIHQGVRLSVRLAPGDYRVYFSIGPQWFGEKYFFGDQARCGYFDLTVGEDANTRVHLDATADGSLAITDLTWDDLRRQAGVQ